jgi:hypothetical protein
MAGRPTRQHLSRFAQWERPTAYDDSAVRECSVKGASVLKHTAGDSRAVAETRNRLTGARIVLCADCLSYVEAYHWAAANGVHQMSEHKLLALSYVWRAECGYEVPTPLAYRGSLAELGAVTNALHSLARTGHIKRIGNSYLMRDACPSCFRRGCSAECMLHMGVSFAPRREACLL